MDEVTALFELVGDEFGGDLVSTMPYTPQPEGSMVGVLDDARGQFNVTVGSYPAIDGRNRLKILSTDAEAVAEASRCYESASWSPRSSRRLGLEALADLLFLYSIMRYTTQWFVRFREVGPLYRYYRIHQCWFLFFHKKQPVT